MATQDSAASASPASNEDLFRRFLTPNMLVYFARKCPHLSEGELRQQLAELLKFLIFVRDFPGNIIFGKEIDEMWHLWIMQTREYEALCAALPGGEIRHHSSRDYPETGLTEEEARDILAAGPTDEIPAPAIREGGKERFEQNAQRLLSFFASYYLTFGPIVPEVVPLWPPLKRLADRLDWTAEKLNAFLGDQVRRAAEAKLVAQ